jgi:hypothetical protein
MLYSSSFDALKKSLVGVHKYIQVKVNFSGNPDPLGSVVLFCTADPGSGAFLTPGSGMGKKSRSGSGMNIPDHVS